MDTQRPFQPESEPPDERRADRAKLSAAAGGGTPRTVIRGESPNPHPDKGETNPYGAITDWLNVTYSLEGTADPLGDFLEGFYAVAGGAFGHFEDRRRGAHGWTRSFVSENGKALFAFGGQRDTAFLSMGGEACALVRDWDALAVWLRDWCDARITRWDGAVDDFEGHHSVNHAVDAYKAGAFKCGGRQPQHELRGDWLNPMGLGRTLYVGSRRSGKYFRVYEKGKKHGDPSSPWVRHEVELHNVDRVLPWDVIWHPAKYIVGAYPYLDWIGGEGCRIKTIRETSTISVAFLKQHCRRTYGTLFSILKRQGLSDSQIVQQLSREGVPARLVISEILGIRPNSDEAARGNAGP